MSFATHCECLCQAYTCKVCGYSRREGFGHSTAHAAGAQLLPLIAERACNTDSQVPNPPGLLLLCRFANTAVCFRHGREFHIPIAGSRPFCSSTQTVGLSIQLCKVAPSVPPPHEALCSPRAAGVDSRRRPVAEPRWREPPTNGARVHHPRDVRHSHSCLRCTGATAWEAARGHRPAVPLCAVRSQCSCAGARMQASGELHGHTTWQRRHVR